MSNNTIHNTTYCLVSTYFVLICFIQGEEAWIGKPLVQVYLCLAFVRPISQMLSGPSETFGYTEQLASKVGEDKGAALLLLCLCAREMGEDTWNR